ncbi:MAG: hypothetical protein ABFD44_04800 [Anaerolineaceae bacterium]
MIPILQTHCTVGGQVTVLPQGWELEIPAATTAHYRVAQLDDDQARSRRAFLHHPPVTLSLEAQISAADLPGTWGFGWWNDPFSFNAGIRGSGARLPALPQAAWFFYASEHSFLSLREDLPENGFFAGTFSAPRVPSLLLTPGILGLPLLAWRAAVRKMRRAASGIVRQDAARVNVDATAWHTYRIEWGEERVCFAVDGKPVLETGVVPKPPLHLVIWVDNQFAALTPQGRVAGGTLPGPAARLNVAKLQVF